MPDPRTVDAALAEGLFGIAPGARCSVGDYLCESPNSPDGWYCGKCGYSGSWGSDNEMKDHPLEIPRYSSSWEGLGLVVGAMRLLKGCRVSIVQRSPTEVEAEFRWWNHDRWEKASVMGVVEEIPMAVALAALRALGKEVPDA